MLSEIGSCKSKLCEGGKKNQFCDITVIRFIVYNLKLFGFIQKRTLTLLHIYKYLIRSAKLHRGNVRMFPSTAIHFLVVDFISLTSAEISRSSIT